MQQRNYSRRSPRFSARKTYRNSMTSKGMRNGTSSIVKDFFNMLMNIRLYHWSTTSYARHIGSGALYESLSLLIDQFVETYMGRYKRIEYKENSFDVHVKHLNDGNIVEILREYCEYLEYEVPKHLNKVDTDLLNIRDEILGEINQTLYLFTLN